MGLRKSIVAVCVGAVALSPSVAAAEGKMSAWVFGDYYYFADSHDSTSVDKSGFWFRLINLAWDEKFDESFSSRIRLEAASPGSFTGVPQALQVYTKDAWIKWTHARQSVILGLATPPSHSFTEDIWGYRYIEKFPFEVAGFGGSRDIGLGVTGWLLQGDRLGYHLMVGNGAGLYSEQDSDKRASGSVRFKVTSALSLEAYGDYEKRPDHEDRVTFRGFAGYRAQRMRGAVEYDVQNRDQTTGGSYHLRVVSGFVAAGATEKVWLFGRVDRRMDADPGYTAASAPGRPYLPYDASVSNTFILAGLEFLPRENVAFTPNVEMILYDEPDGGGAAPTDDVVARFTFMFKY